MCLVVAAVCAAAGGSSSRAQTAVDGAIAGHLFRADGKPAAHVAVEVRAQAERGVLLRAVTANDGSFLLLRLPEGQYAVHADGVLDALEHVEAGGVVDVTLRPMSIQRSTQQTRADTSESDTLPVQSWEELALHNDVAADASVRGETYQADQPDDSSFNASAATVETELPTQVSFRGLAPTQNASEFDGVNSEQEFRAGERGQAGGGAAMGASSSAYARGGLGSLHVRANAFSAEYGGAGGVVSATSARGGDAVHGELEYSVRESAWDAANPFSIDQNYQNGAVTSSLVKPQDTLQNAGGRVSGPMFQSRWHGRVFGLANLDQQWRTFPGVSSPSDPEFFSLTPTQTGVLGTRGVSTAATNVALNYLESLMGPLPRSADRTLLFARVDVSASAKDDVALSYARSRFSSPSGAGAGPSTAVIARGTASLADNTIRIDAEVARWLHRFGPRVNNELRFQFARDDEFEQAEKPLPQEPAIGPGGYAPQVSIASGSFVYGSAANALGRQAYPDEQRVEAVDTAQMIVGKHLLTLGFDWSRVDDRIVDLRNLAGNFDYESSVINGNAGGLVDWITDYTFGVNAYPNGGCPSINAAPHYFCFHSFTQSFGEQQTEFALNQFAGFAQDLWRVQPGLTVTAGVRYEYELLPLPQQPNVALDAVFGARGATSIFPEDRNNFGPRLSVAWSPRNGKWGTLRLGYGGFFGREPGATVRAALVDTALASSTTHIRITPKTVTACPQMPTVGFGFPCDYVTAPPAAVEATTSATVYAKNFRLPAVQQGELTLEREVTSRVSLRATYSGAFALQLMKPVDINIAPATSVAPFVLQGGDGRSGARNGEMFVVPIYTARLAPQWGPVTALTSSANATWHSGTLAARWLGTKGVSASANYTWSKAIDYGAAQGAVPQVNAQFDPYSVGYDKGVADFNLPQRFTAEATWPARFEGVDSRITKFVNGWKLAGIVSGGSGRAYSYEILGGTHLPGGKDSINGSGGSVYLPTCGRNTLRMPTQWNVNARIARDFRLTDRLRLNTFVEVFNVANHSNVSRVETRAFLPGPVAGGVTPLVFQNAAAIAAEGLNEQPFGAETSSTAASAAERQIQLGLRLNF